MNLTILTILTNLKSQWDDIILTWCNKKLPLDRFVLKISELILFIGKGDHWPNIDRYLITDTKRFTYVFNLTA